MRKELFICDICGKEIHPENDSEGYPEDLSVWFRPPRFERDCGLRDVCKPCQETTTIAKARELAMNLHKKEKASQ